MMETWKSVIGYEGFYEVSDRGTVRSIDRRVPGRWGIMTKPGKRLSPRPDTNKHLMVLLCRDSKGKNCLVHRLVMTAFKGESPLFVDHINGNPQDNRLENLRYCTCRENCSFDNVKRKRSSKYIGVSWMPDRKKWQVGIFYKGKRVSLGHFDDEDEAGWKYIRVRASLALVTA